MRAKVMQVEVMQVDQRKFDDGETRGCGNT
jgi:hypothetical protein